MTPFTIVQQAPLPERPSPIISIGAGGIVRDAHYPAYQQAGFTVVGLYDVNAARAAEMAARFNVPKVYGSLQDALTKAPADAVFDVAVPAVALLDILPHIPDGRAVLIQKPMGETLADARKVRELCRRKSLIAAVNFQMRYAPYILAARSLIEQGAIGEVHDMEVRVTVYTPWQLWSFLEGISRVEILYHSIHYLDLIRAFLGEPDGIYAKTAKHPKQSKLANTRTSMALDYGDTLRANIQTNHGHEFGPRHQESYVKWEGTRGAINIRLGVLLNYPMGEPDAFEYCVLDEGQAPVWQTVSINGTWFPDAFIGSMASLMRYVEGSDKMLPTSVEDAIKTMALVEAAYESSAHGATKVRRDEG